MMSKFHDKTSIGGPQEGFKTTQWSKIFKAKTTDEDQRNAIINTLLQEYWKPVYCYIRRKGYNNEQAKDLTQGFFYEIILGKHLIEQADQEKGKFRTFLLRALDHYLISAKRAENAIKRHPQKPLACLEDINGIALPIASKEMKPDEAFAYVWASVLLDQVIAEVRQACSIDDKKIHWQVFHARVLKPIMEGGPVPSLRNLCRKFKIEDQAKASNMIVTVKRRFQKTLSSRVRQHVNSEEDVAQEIRELMEILSGKSAR
jgi:DNA-directed RNA polymerase specialized sigma24 family protein